MGNGNILLGGGGGKGGGNPAMDWHPIQEGVTILLIMLQATETGISSGPVGLWPMCPFTLPYKLYITHIMSVYVAQRQNAVLGYNVSICSIPTLSALNRFC